MIQEALKFLTSKASLRSRKNGALYESVAFESRAKRLKNFWRSHWEESMAAVDGFVNQPQLSDAKTLLILASGSLFEIPIFLLLQRFEKIILVDFVFPKKVRRIAKKNPKIELVEANLNDCDEIAKLISHADLILSCNVLSQLHLFEKEKDPNLFQQRHFDLLKKAKKPVLLWTDTVRHFSPKGQTHVVQKDPTVFIDLPTAWKKWSWFIAPSPELHKDYDVSLKVEAFLL